ncbi:membrane protein [[Pantoea] beijingensis]|uniref:Membrane protein n=1 Tax=[Pantoea] beijingensis TaxID=1324864 RepID=A0A443I9C1_9GAMM|nr:MULTISPECIES: hypothetical protein [Erwiniaceae]RWR00702.1 membrane protein [[Pantoea] beijingensis]
MGLFSWIIIGVFTGLLGRRFSLTQPGSLLVTLVLSVVGALVGGFISVYFNWGTLATLNLRALLLAISGSLLMLLVAKFRI